MQPERVLIVEDNHLLSALAELTFKACGIQTHVARTGSQAIEAVIHNDYTLILMDLCMPEMDGLEATRRIRYLQSSRGQHTPIVAVTSRNEREACIKAGMDDHYLKPANYKSICNQWFKRPVAVEA